MRDSCNNQRKAIYNVRQNAGTVVDLVIAGDFNQHDQLWGEEDVALERQGKADSIINLMTELALNSLLLRGTKTWHSGDYKTIIDLVLASEELTDTTLKCMTHKTEHGSDHRAIETVFDISVPVSKQQEWLLLKNAPWKEINARIARTLDTIPTDGTV